MAGGSIRKHNNGILGMRTRRNVFLIGSMVVPLAGIPALPQQPPAAVQANPARGCAATPQQLAANKRVAMEFFRTTGEARVALADPMYKQHNPAYRKRAAENKVSDYDEFKSTFLAQAGRGGATGARGPAAGPTPPSGSAFEIVTAECDIVTIVHTVNRQDPTAELGNSTRSSPLTRAA